MGKLSLCVAVGFAVLAGLLAPALHMPEARGAPTSERGAAILADPAPRAARRAECLGWLDAGYPSGLEEASCVSEFDLPSPFLIVCARGRRRGFRDATQRDACVDFLSREAQRASEAYVRP